ncbi:MAG: penicillin acylase family protein [Pseudomonadota bacterium]|nr:penicillin acylase family protein [Pseudomonadota bacterium]
MRWIKRTLLVAFAVLLLAAALLAIFVQRVLPQTQGAIELQLPAAPLAGLRIERDAWGVPTIRADSAHDAWFGLGFAHAQDRLWQLETHRRIAAGRLAEAFGPAAVDTDRFLRALGVRQAAAAQWALLPAESRAVLQAYADGINAFVQQQMRARPPEFVILGLQPEPWTPEDSLGWALMMAWDLGGNWGSELLRLRLALRMPVERIDQLLPPYPREAPLTSADYAALFRSLKLSGAPAVTSWLRLPQIAPPSGVEGVGSNNWVVAGSHTTTGHPLLANDPHLKLSTPSLWYLARIEMPGLKVAGATLPGLPGVVLGQNEHIAWGFTNTGPDVQDLYIEETDANDPARYRTPDGWARFESHSEVIHVRGGADVAITVRRTRHGPVLSDAGIVTDLLGSDPKAKPVPPTEAHVLALRWTALDPDNDAITPALAMQAASSVDAFIDATRGWVAPMQNMVVADDAGRIAMVAAGRVPLRKPDNDLHGLVPAPGWDARYDWAGFVPADATPRERDPERGFIVTANQRITPPGYPYFISSDWALPYRYDRITQLLAARPKHSIDDLAAIQGDLRSLAVAPLLPWLLRAESKHPLAAAALAQLKDFDGVMAGNRAAPLIYWAWQRQLAAGIFKDDGGDALWRRSLQSRTFQDALEGVLARNDVSWCDDSGTPAVETCAMQSGTALTRALDELQSRFGNDVATWQWQRAHQMRAEHRPFSHVAWLARWFEQRAPVGGDTYTINVAKVGLRPDPDTGELYLDEHGPSLRALYDLGDRTQSRVMQSSGQSGIVFSTLYRSFLPLWLRVQSVPLWARGLPEQTLVLAPRSAASVASATSAAPAASAAASSSR